MGNRGSVFLEPSGKPCRMFFGIFFWREKKRARTTYSLLFPTFEDLSANSFTSRLPMQRGAIPRCQGGTRECGDTDMRHYQISLVRRSLLHQQQEWKVGEEGIELAQELSNSLMTCSPPPPIIIIIIIKIISSILIYIDKYAWNIYNYHMQKYFAITLIPKL